MPKIALANQGSSLSLFKIQDLKLKAQVSRFIIANRTNCSQVIPALGHSFFEYK